MGKQYTIEAACSTIMRLLCLTSALSVASALTVAELTPGNMVTAIGLIDQFTTCISTSEGSGADYKTDCEAKYNTAQTIGGTTSTFTLQDLAQVAWDWNAATPAAYKAKFGTNDNFLDARMTDIFDKTTYWNSLGAAGQAEGFKKTATYAIPVFVLLSLIDYDEKTKWDAAAALYFGKEDISGATNPELEDTIAEVAKKRCKNYEDNTGTAFCTSDTAAPQNDKVKAAFLAITDNSNAADYTTQRTAIHEAIKRTFTWAGLRYLNKMDNDFNKCGTPSDHKEHQGEGYAFWLVVSPLFIDDQFDTKVLDVYTGVQSSGTRRGENNEDSFYSQALPLFDDCCGTDAIGDLNSPGADAVSNPRNCNVAKVAATDTCPTEEPDTTDPTDAAATTMDSPAAVNSMSWVLVLGALATVLLRQ